MVLPYKSTHTKIKNPRSSNTFRVSFNRQNPFIYNLLNNACFILIDNYSLFITYSF